MLQLLYVGNGTLEFTTISGKRVRMTNLQTLDLDEDLNEKARKYYNQLKSNGLRVRELAQGKEVEVKVESKVDEFVKEEPVVGELQKEPEVEIKEESLPDVKEDGFTKESLMKKTLNQLITIAKEKGLTVPDKVSKEKLSNLILGGE